ncbi:MAG: hypothetical protein ACK5O2_06255, partial [Microthrixaceae bacterium]
MIEQFKVEVRRLLHRRVLVAFGVFALFALVVVGLSVFYSSGPEEQFSYTEEYSVSGAPGAEVEPGFTTEVVPATFCPSSLVTSHRGADGRDDIFNYDDACPESTPSSIPEVDGDIGFPSLFHPWNGSIAYFSVGAMLALWVLAASFIGGEFRHGTVETALVAEPRRARLLSLRLGAVLTVGVGSYLVAAVGFLVVIAPAWA